MEYWKEVIVAYFKVLSWHFGNTKETMKTPLRIPVAGRIL